MKYNKVKRKTSTIMVFLVAILHTSIFLSVQSIHAEEEKLLMATTTSTDNTGLLDYLMPSFTISF
jgi:tungstate transport system substrate-binding protein